MKSWAVFFMFCVAFGCPMVRGDRLRTTPLRLTVVDADSDVPLACRVYARTEDGRWLFARSGAEDGSAIVYDKQRSDRSLEKHTTVSARSFIVDSPPGKLELRIERGKEYLPYEASVDVGDRPQEEIIRLRRFCNMAARGWYSGDTHVHRSLGELPNLLQAEDLNVALPLTSWVTAAHKPPSAGDDRSIDVAAELIQVDETHVIYPLNTEYEIFTVGGQRHTLGAIFALGHREPFRIGVPPVRAFASEARRQGAILDLDKHSWPWSLMLVPVAGVNLFELANNHCWRTEFGFPAWTIEAAPEYMRLQRSAEGLTERGWIDFGFETYYALLNCGFRMRPSAGTASGVHPVPLGFGRVYVQLPDGFAYDRWMQGLAAGRSFVTTGPLLDVIVDGRPPGAVIQVSDDSEEHRLSVTGSVLSSQPLQSIQVLVNGRIVQQPMALNRKTDSGAYENPLDADVTLGSSCWIAVRVFEDRADRRVRFAHSSPVHVEWSGRPLRPRREQVEYLVRRMDEELERNQNVLDEASLQEYRQARDAYQQRLPPTP